jgi:hypothetical protein
LFTAKKPSEIKSLLILYNYPGNVLEDLNVEIIQKPDLQNMRGGMTVWILKRSEYTHVRQQSVNQRELLLKNVL